MRIQDYQQRLEESLRGFLQQMDQEEILLCEKDDERLRIKVYKTQGQKDFPLEKVAFMLLENGWVTNKDDKKLLDKTELIVVTSIPVDNIPLPVFAGEASLHFSKYDHMNADLFPLSKDQHYREIFCKPVKILWKKNEELPGLLPLVRDPTLDESTSGGMLVGDFPVSVQDKSTSWWFEYVDLYNAFLKNFESYSVLKEPSIIEEGKITKDIFLSRFKKASPRILLDIPNLYSEENGIKLGELLF
jgi:hypothetical protein